jgi:hypothetical protein
MTQAKKKPSTVRRVADATLDVAVGGTALAADKALETLDKVTDRAEEALRRGRREARDQTRSARRHAEEAVHQAAGGHDSRPYEERSRDELYELASERDIEGRSSMNKAELIAALRENR